MKHFAGRRFWKAYEALAPNVRVRADKSYELLKADPQHPSLHFKRIGSLWSVRIGRRYRALGHDVDGDVLWFWIGTHAEYDKIIG